MVKAMKLIKSLFGSKKQSSASPENTLLIVDASGLGDARQEKKLTPRDQIDILQNLSKVNKSEGLEIHVVFEGEPLRKVDHGNKFDDLTVYFCADSSAVPAFVLGRVKDSQRRYTVTVVTASPELEVKVVATGGNVMRDTTFKKAFDRSGGGAGNGNRRRRRPQGKSGRGPRSGEEGGNKDRPPRKPREERDEQDTAAGVSALIDLVD
jgi:predicted RNA-binding protein with PIN domain